MRVVRISGAALADVALAAAADAGIASFVRAATERDAATPASTVREAAVSGRTMRVGNVAGAALAGLIAIACAADCGVAVAVRSARRDVAEIIRAAVIARGTTGVVRVSAATLPALAIAATTDNALGTLAVRRARGLSAHPEDAGIAGRTVRIRRAVEIATLALCAKTLQTANAPWIAISVCAARDRDCRSSSSVWEQGAEKRSHRAKQSPAREPRTDQTREIVELPSIHAALTPVLAWSPVDLAFTLIVLFPDDESVAQD